MKTWDTRKLNSWGNNIQYRSRDTSKRKADDDYGADIFRWVGWTKTAPLAGDRIIAAMTGGDVGEFEIIEVEKMIDPPDMWFANSVRVK